ncbi:SDR family oxidoreductase [Sansalvadorimonas verongulae]|uniref:SDR family oxidoreductase n=1 Tax=Sansalvadorimonas verongulae TaxID=2172824 RepID=UPI0012BB5AEE|nr:SDR family oxidoreductase [Sansalvadorimonas verongulae]MTI15380.1 SDR family oxidoreductase [Sansalvadorimonas verongulae]
MSQTIVITGARRGIGLEFTRQYLEAGDTVFAIIRGTHPSDGLAALTNQHPQLTILYGDVTSQSDLDRLKDELTEKLQGQSISLLINNAGIYGPRDALFGKVQPQDWLQVLQVNTIAPMMVSQSLSGLFSAGSKIAIISSKMGSMSDNTSGGSYIYRSSKAAVNAVGKSLSHDLAERDIAVGIYHPGWVQTDMGGASALISTPASVSGLRTTIAALTMENSGEFLNYDGSSIGW